MIIIDLNTYLEKLTVPQAVTKYYLVIVRIGKLYDIVYPIMPNHLNKSM